MLEYACVAPMSEDDPGDNLKLINCKHMFISADKLPIDIQSFVLDRIYHCDRPNRLGNVQKVKMFSLAVGKLTRSEISDSCMYIDNISYYCLNGNSSLLKHHSHIDDLFLLAYINNILVYLFRLTDSISYDDEMQILNLRTDSPTSKISLSKNHTHTIDHRNSQLDDNIKNLLITQSMNEVKQNALICVVSFAASLVLLERLFTTGCILFIIGIFGAGKTLSSLMNVYTWKNGGYLRQSIGCVTGKEIKNNSYYIQLNHSSWIEISKNSFDMLNFNDQCIVSYAKRFSGSDNDVRESENYIVEKNVIKIE